MWANFGDEKYFWAEESQMSARYYKCVSEYTISAKTNVKVGDKKNGLKHSLKDSLFLTSLIKPTKVPDLRSYIMIQQLFGQWKI